VADQQFRRQSLPGGRVPKRSPPWPEPANKAFFGCERTDRAFDDVGIDLDAAIVEKLAEPVPAAERIADRLGELPLARARLVSRNRLRLAAAAAGVLRSCRTVRRSWGERPRIFCSIA